MRSVLILIFLITATVAFAQAPPPPPPGSGPGISASAPLRITSVQPQNVVYSNTTIFFVVTGTAYSEYNNHTGALLPPPGYTVESKYFDMVNVGPQSFQFTAGIALTLPGNTADDILTAIISMNARSPNLGIMAVPSGAACTTTVGF